MYFVIEVAQEGVGLYARPLALIKGVHHSKEKAEQQAASLNTDAHVYITVPVSMAPRHYNLRA